jgi:hypothetical protein
MEAFEFVAVRVEAERSHGRRYFLEQSFSVVMDTMTS